jgi:hypothetical protein
MKLILTSFIFLLTGYLSAQNYNIRGFIYDKSNGEVMAFEKVKLLNAADSTVAFGSVSDVNGFFSIPKIPIGNYILVIENFSYKRIAEPIKVEKSDGIEDKKYILEKDASVKEMEEVTVSAESKQKRTEVNMSQIKLDKKSIERIPSVGGENDIIGAFSVTPGVVTTGDQGGQLYVRGGTPIQNKILLDGMTIYSPFHSIGFFSVFETELIKNADIYTGGFDSRFGGRISSIMDISYRDGNRQKFGGKISTSPFLAKAVLEGPLSNKKDGTLSNGSYLLSGKHSLLDYTSKKLYTTLNDGNGMPFNFTDLYGKLTFNSDAGSKVSFFGFNHRDSVNYPEADIDWKATGGGMNFILIPGSSPVFIKGHINGSFYETSFTEEGSLPRYSSIGGFDLGFDFTYFLKNEGEFNYGINLGSFNTKFETVNESYKKISLEVPSTEIGLYTNYRLVKNRWVIQPNVRGQIYASYNTISIEPRIGAKYNATEKIRVKLSGGRYSQNFTSASSDRDVVNIFNGLLTAPTNVQSKFINEFGNEKEIKNGLQYSWHAIAGTEVDVTRRINVNIEGYYKYFPQLSNINQNKIVEDEAQFAAVADVFKKDFIIESGQSYGIDFLIKYSNDRLFLWGVYSWGKSTRWNGFEQYFPVFDRRHNVNLVGTYLFGKKKDLELSIRWNLGSGLPFTPTAANYQSEPFKDGVTTNILESNPSTVSTYLGEFNSERLPYYHRLDITAKKQFEFKNKNVLEVIASVTNSYNRSNIFYVNRVTNKTIYQFPILPSVGISYKF